MPGAPDDDDDDDDDDDPPGAAVVYIPPPPMPFSPVVLLLLLVVVVVVVVLAVVEVTLMFDAPVSTLPPAGSDVAEPSFPPDTAIGRALLLGAGVGVLLVLIAGCPMLAAFTDIEEDEAVATDTVAPLG